MERELVKKLHKDIDEALRKVAEANGFTYKPGNLTYSDADVRGKVQFILASKKDVFEARNVIKQDTASGLKAGDEVSLVGHPEQYVIDSFTNRGSAIIILKRDFGTPSAKKYRAKTVYLSKVGTPTVGFNTRPVRTRSEEDILNALRDVENALSPENLSCDGELPKSEINRRYSKLMAEKTRLVKELGRTPTDKELYPEIYK